MTRFSLRFGFLVLLIAAAATPAMALNVVNSGFPQVNCIFNPTCVMPVWADMSSPIMGNGFVQSRVVQASANSAAAGKWLYMYRIDLRQVAGITYIPYVSGFWVPFGGTWSHDYNFNGIYTDHVFNGSWGGLGTEGVGSATAWWFGSTFFDFSGTVDAGSYPGGGESSYFIGIASSYGPKVGTLTIVTDSGNVNVSGYVPNVP